MRKIMKSLIALLCVVAMIGVMIPADLMSVEAAEVQEDSYAYKKVITSCDSKGAESNIVETLVNPNDSSQSWGTGGTITSDTKAEGTASLGSYKAQSSTGTVANIFLANPVDVRGYKYFSVKLFVDNVDNMTADDNGGVLNVYLRTNDTPATTNVHLQFVISKDQLQSNSWVTLNLSFEQAKAVSTGYDGRIDWLQFSLVNAAAGNVQFYIDDICAVNEEEGLLLYDCDQKTGKLAVIECNGGGAVETTNKKEGGSAWTSKVWEHSNGTYRVQTQIKFQTANKLDIDDFVNDGYLQFWLYINKKDYMTGNLTIELGSGGAATTNSVHYTYSNNKLQEEWNLVQIPLNSYSSSYDEINWEEINYFRLLSIGVADADTMNDQYMLLDDIRVIDVASEIEVREITTGVVTPTETTVPVMDGYVFGGYYNNYDGDTKTFSNPLTEAREANTDAPVYIKWVTEDVMTVKAQVRQEDEDYKLVLTSCDSRDENSNLIDSIAVGDKTYTTLGGISKDITYLKEGEGCLTRSQTLSTSKSTTLYNIYLSNPVDVKGYKYFSFQFYLPSLDSLADTGSALGVVLNSEYGAISSSQLIFYVAKSDLQVGWNELKLPFATADVPDTYNGSAINYIRILAYKAKSETSLTTYVDDICVLNENEGFLIADCDNKTDKFATVTGTSTSIDKTNKKEGIGAVKAQCFDTGAAQNNYRMLAEIKLSDVNKLDLSSYEAKGFLHLWLYINDKTNLSSNATFTIELSSAGKADSNEVSWDVKASALAAGCWNELTLPLSAPSAQTNPTIIWAAVNYIRVFTVNATETAVTNEDYILIDDISIVDYARVATCDSKDGLTAKNLEGTDVVTTDVKQGTGKFVREDNTTTLLHILRFNNGIDFSKFRGNRGSLRFWFFVEDPTLMKDEGNIIVELSHGTANATTNGNNQRYIIHKADLVAGWNEIYIYLDDTVNATSNGNVTWSSIKHIKVYSTTTFTSACTTMIDDITLVPGNKETMDIRFVSTVDSLGYRLVGYEITQSRSKTPLTTKTTNVYSALYALGHDGIRSSVTPKGISGVDCSTYIHAATVVNIPNRLWDAEFTVTPYWMTQSGGEGKEDGTIVKGASKTYTMNYLLNKSNELQGQTNTIDIYLIAGQSNAAGSTHIACGQYNHQIVEKTHTISVDVLTDGTLESQNSKYISGFDSVLYSGFSTGSTVTMQPVKANIHNNGQMGPEVGMAESLSTYYTGENGRVAGLIKYAWGGTSLLDKENTETDTRQDERGNWVSPSYEEYLIEQNGAVLHGEMTGRLYDNFIAQVEKSLKEYEVAGYNPVIKGLYWMQGEDDRTLEADYEVAFEFFAEDVRNDLAVLTGDEGLRAMPIIIGEISETFSAATDFMKGINSTFIALQHKLAEEIDNCYIAYNGKYHINVVNEAGESEYAEGVVDGAHWNWRDCLSIGNDVGNIIKKNILGITE